MAKNNQTALILTLVIVACLLSITGGIGWLIYKQLIQSKSGSTNAGAAAPSNSTSSSSLPNQVAVPKDGKLDYTKLQQDLLQKNWKAADQDTYELMLQAAGPEAQAKGFTPKDEMETLPCSAIKTIDALWSKASDRKLGFTAQQDILRALGDYRKMYAQVGWQSSTGQWLIGWIYNPQSKRMEYQPGKEPNFKNPPPGHLPTVERGYNFDVSLNSALQRCGI